MGAIEALPQYALDARLERLRLAVRLDAPAVARPGEKVRIRVELADGAGRPQSGLVKLFAVDEGVLALNQHQQLTMINRAALALLSLSTEHDGDTLAERIPIPTLHELVVHALAGQPERR